MRWSDAGRRRAVLLSTLSLAGGVLLAVGPPAQAAGSSCDTTGPTIVDVAMSPGAVNVTSGARRITFTVKVTDDVTGATEVSVEAASPRLPGGRSRYASVFLSRVSGTATDGTWTGFMRIPQGTAPGRWTFDVSANDAAWNGMYSTSDDLKQHGWPWHFAVTSVPDQAAPVVSSFQLSTGSVDTRRSGKQVTATAVVTDSGGSGVRNVYVTLQRSVRGKGSYGFATSLHRVRGTDTFRRTFTVPRFADRAAKVVWPIHVEAQDRIGNGRRLGPAALAAQHWPAGLHITTIPDSTPPVLRVVSVAPQSVDVSTKSSFVTATARATDDRSGVYWVNLDLSRPAGGSSLGFFLFPMHGFTRHASFTDTEIVHRCMTTGVYSLRGRFGIPVQIGDRTGNHREYTAAQLRRLGLNATLTVN